MTNPILTAISIGISDLPRSTAFYEALGFTRKAKGAEGVAFFDAGGVMLALYPWKPLAEEAGLSEVPRPPGFFGATLAINYRSDAEVDTLMRRARDIGARILKDAVATHYDGYAGYFADPDGHTWEVVRAPGFTFTDDGRLIVPD